MSPIFCIKRLIVAKGVGLPEAGSAPVIVNKDNPGALEWTMMLRLWQTFSSSIQHLIHLLVEVLALTQEEKITN